MATNSSISKYIRSCRSLARFSAILLCAFARLQSAAALPPANVTIKTEVAHAMNPGAGFSGPSTQPPSVGVSGAVGYSAQAIARWDVVPFQTFSGVFPVGVLAFHREGINRVEFSANGGPWLAVSAPQLNPITGVVEYLAYINAADFSDGPVEIRAIVFPNVGGCRVLAGAMDEPNLVTGQHSMILTANGGGKLGSVVRYVSPNGSDTNDGLSASKPFATPNQAAYSITQAQGNSDGGVIYLLPGSYTLTSALWNNNSRTVDRWMTVKTAPGYTKADVKIVGTAGAGFNSKLVKLEDVTITGAIGSGGPLTDFVWIDNCVLQGPGQDVGSVGIDASWTGAYITKSNFFDVTDAALGYRLVRDVVVKRSGGDKFSNSGIVVNSTVIESDPASKLGQYHPDVYQHTGVLNNVILYGIKAVESIVNTAGVFQYNNTATGVAIVNCQISAQGNIGGPVNHMYVKNSSMVTAFVSGFVATDTVFENVTFFNTNPGAWPGVTFR